MEVILVEASQQDIQTYTAFSNTCGNAEDIQWLLSKISSSTFNANLLQRLMRVLPFLALTNEAKMTLLCEHFRPLIDFDKFDSEHTAEDTSKLEQFCVLVQGLEKNSVGNLLRDRFWMSGFVKIAVDYIQRHAPPVRASVAQADSEDWNEFINAPSLRYVLRLLTGWCSGHEATQIAVFNDCIPIIHRLEQISSDQHVGSLAENLLEALKSQPEAAQKIQDVRQQTKAEKKRLAMAMRKKQLGQLGMKTNEKGQVTVKSSLLEQMTSDIGEESGLVCVICREGYKFQPNKVLGIYTYTKRANAEDFESKVRKTLAYTTVSHFNVVHVDCHMAAVRQARSRDEWESAALQNGNTRCNGLLPLWGPQVLESAFASFLARHNTYLQEGTGHRDIGFVSTLHDLKLLLLRFAQEKSFSEESGGGGPQSNMHLAPYILHMALYVINTTRVVAREEKNINTYLELPVDKWVAASWEAEGPFYYAILSLAIRSVDKWKSERLMHLRRIIVTAHARHTLTVGASKITDKSARPYSTYKHGLILFGLVDAMYNIMFQGVQNPNSDSSWPQVLADFIRHSDEILTKSCEKVVAFYQDDLLPATSFTELCDVLGILEDLGTNDYESFIPSLLSGMN